MPYLFETIEINTSRSRFDLRPDYADNEASCDSVVFADHDFLTINRGYYATPGTAEAWITRVGFHVRRDTPDYADDLAAWAGERAQ